MSLKLSKQSWLDYIPEETAAEIVFAYSPAF